MIVSVTYINSVFHPFFQFKVFYFSILSYFSNIETETCIFLTKFKICML